MQEHRKIQRRGKAIQDTRIGGAGDEAKQYFAQWSLKIMFCSTVETKNLGTGIQLENSLKENVIKFTVMSKRIQCLRMKEIGNSITTISVRALTEDKGEEEKIQFLPLPLPLS